MIYSKITPIKSIHVCDVLFSKIQKKTIQSMSVNVKGVSNPLCLERWELLVRPHKAEQLVLGVMDQVLSQSPE